MKNRSPRKTLLSALVAAALVSVAGLALVRPISAAPALDGGIFPTSSPTATPLPTWTPTVQAVILTLIPAYPAITDTPQSLDAGQPSNIQEAQQPTPVPVDRGGNPLVMAAYIGLFIFLLVGLWMLFGRRGLQQGP